MSNPFRRSSLAKGAGGSNSSNTSPGPRGTEPLSIDTKVRTTSQKHVNFASPPAIISPISYSSSPESSRQDFPSNAPIQSSPLPAPTDYSHAFAIDPFAEQPGDGDDSAIEKALENARVNTAIVTAPVVAPKINPDSAVKDTLARFASAPRGPSFGQHLDSRAKKENASSKAIMDVDAFKRMLLTGSATPGEKAASSQPVSTQSVSDNSSSADSASISQHSLFEINPTTREESPRTSEELDMREHIEHRTTPGPSSSSKRPPPPPKSRRGKASKDATSDSGSMNKFDNFINSLSLPPKHDASSEMSSMRSPSSEQLDFGETSSNSYVPEASKRAAPPPPLTRRKSQQQPSKPLLTRSSSSRQSVLSDSDPPVSPQSTTTPRAPPPPPSRRSASFGERRPSLDLASTSEIGSQSSQQPTPSQTPSYPKKSSQLPPPPLPPPRRGRGSSRSSVDTQRPSMLALGITDPLKSQDDSTEKHSSLGERDILADLAALQREVDAARASAGR
ncbi:hypothetical protein PV08_07850 [Exophiala spinifera]|uniref:Uncharacterized protein n=1 Tax=Exophiala spinifera TaxID=91928 RepID=A0A0D2B854_9EURO|nr:uncharacterized protein PV08_07850 [Exophiala spinifera]KIW15063.1 hypothetical protein PV08_07850 [Exophiala spinifera]